MMNNLPKVTLLGRKNLFTGLIVAVILILVLSFYLKGSVIEAKAEAEATLASTEVVDNESLVSQRDSLINEDTALENKMNDLKLTTITKFSRDTFSTAISNFADMNNLRIMRLNQGTVKEENDSFYSIPYDLTINGSIYSMMEFLKLLDTMGYQYSMKGFSFRQDGTYTYLERPTIESEVLTWVTEAKTNVTEDQIQKILDTHMKLEADNYDYGSSVASPSQGNSYDPLDNLLDDMFQEEVDPEAQKTYEENKTKQAEKTAAALKQKEEDKKLVDEFLKTNYPEGTVIKNGQLIIPMLNGNMTFDISIVFSGNNSGAEISNEYLKLLIPAKGAEDTGKKMTVIWDKRKIAIPAVIEGIDVSVLNGINIDQNSMFTVSWNNNMLSRSVLVSCLENTDDGGRSELKRVAEEIRFLEENGRMDLEIMKYLIFLYQYLQ